MSKPLPYIGVTGCMHPEHVDVLSALFPPFVDSEGPLFMNGLLMSQKTLHGEQNKWLNRYPSREKLHTLFSRSPRAMNIIHFNTDDRDAVLMQLLAMVGLYHGCLEGHLHGFQLNMRWPDPELLRSFRELTEKKNIKFILQIGEKALKDVFHQPAYLARRLKNYEGLVHHALIDGSGGLGKLLDIDFCFACLEQVEEIGLEIGMGVAGGLSPETLHLIVPIIERFPGTSIDAEGKLRDAEDHLDLPRAKAYVRRALALY
jgi:hypothetical protein